MLSSFYSILINKVRLTEDVFLFTFNNPKNIMFEAGQYLLASIPIGQEKAVKRCYSIANSCKETSCFELIIKIVPSGAASTRLAGLNLGDSLLFEGPAGVFKLQKTILPKVFLTTGTGIAPIRSFFRSFFLYPDPAFLHTKTTLYWGLRYEKDLFLAQELLDLQIKNTLFSYTLCFSRQPNSVQAQNITNSSSIRIDGALLAYLNKLSHESLMDIEFYLCGSRVVVSSLADILQQKGVEKNRIFTEKY